MKIEFPIVVEHKSLTLKLFNYMDYPKDKPARNVEAFDKNGNWVWTIESLGGNPGTDCYTSIKSVNGLIHAFNFQCYDCVINEKDGSIVSSSFTK